MKNIIINVVITIIAIDIIGYCAWLISGQTPVDNFHVGILTESILNLSK